MAKLIDLMQEPVRTLLPVLLRDKTTGRNIIWATDSYADLGSGFSDKEQIDCGILLRHTDLIKPRVEKSKEDQAARTRKKAEVFTPTWLCNAMNNYCDEDWFGRKDVFNVEQPDHTWTATEDAVWFPKRKTWKQYIDSRRLEITCGEAPFLVSRYDASTGDIIVPPKRRIGLLDRKLRIVNENAKSPDEWVTWAFRAVESCYGYEYQGDNLLLARVNVLLTFLDYYQERMEKDPDTELLRKLAGRIAWNLWQMDGLKDTVPLGRLYEPYHQMSLFDLFPDKDKTDEKEEPEAVSCRIYDWRRENSLVFQSAKEYTDMGKKKLFRYVTGNPPYQSGDNESNSRQDPVYPFFYDAGKQLADKYMLISPARFLFNAGLTSKTWNKIMLSDEHIKVEKYVPNGEDVFPNTDIKGGVAVIYRDSDKRFGAIEEFIPDEKLRAIAQKVKEAHPISLMTIMHGGRSDLLLNEDAMKDYPQIPKDRLVAIQRKNPKVKELAANEEYEIKSSSFDVTPYMFHKVKENSTEKYFHILGLSESKRVWAWIPAGYVRPRNATDNNLDYYKVFIPKASGNGQFGEALSEPVVAVPLDTSTPTFISIGKFSTEDEAVNAAKYIHTKFARALLGILKITQDIVPSKWKYVPLQDFTPSSDIDWSQSVPEIDRQLYRKYGFTADEIDFIETHVKEMV